MDLKKQATKIPEQRTRRLNLSRQYSRKYCKVNRGTCRLRVSLLLLMSVIASTDFETCVSCSKIGGLRVDDVNCQTVTGSPKCCTKSLQSHLFARNWRPRKYRLADSPLAYRVRSTDFRAKERLLAVQPIATSSVNSNMTKTALLVKSDFEL